MGKSDYILFENKPAEFFNEAYPIGNGSIGAMIYGDPTRMRIGVSHDEIWTGHASSDLSAWSKEDYLEAQRLAMNGEYAAATRCLKEKLAKYDAASFTTLGDIFIDIPKGEITEYRRELDMTSGVVEVSFLRNGKPFSARFFVSKPEEALIVMVDCEEPLDFHVSIDYPFTHKKGVKVRRDVVLMNFAALGMSERQDRGNTSPPDVTPTSSTRYTVGCTVSTNGGCDYYEEQRTFKIENAKDFVFFYTVATSHVHGVAFADWGHEEKAYYRIRRVFEMTNEEIVFNHVDDFQELMSRVELQFEGPDYSDVPTSERLRRFAEGNPDPSLVATQFHFGRYLAASGSRCGSKPLNLQGIWNDSVDPPWCSNYTTNINTEMNYWPFLGCGFDDLLEPLEKFLFVLMERGRNAARAIYGARGAAASHNSDIFGAATPVAGKTEWSFFPVSFAWLTREVFNKYLYNRDPEYLRYIYPLIEAAAMFFYDTLIDDGKYLIFCPATSPENSFILNGEECEVGRSTTMYMSIIRETFENFIYAARYFGKARNIRLDIEEMVKRLLPLRITDDGRIEEWYLGDNPPKIEEKDVHHRHISHLYDLYPGRAINTPELKEAARKSLEVRGDASTGWSLAWKLCCKARLHDDEGVMRLIRMFLTPVSPDPAEKPSYCRGGVYPNLFCAHPPFQIDGNFGFAAGIIEMLVGEEDGVLIPLCALPKELGTGYLRGFCLPGNRVVDMDFKDGKVTRINVHERPEKRLHGEFGDAIF